MANGKWTKENFEAHHAGNPHIYTMFCRYAIQAAAVRKHYSAKIIFHRMRWHTDIEERGSQFKIDDGWISHYARLFIEDHPQHSGFFETRERAGGYHSEGKSNGATS